MARLTDRIKNSWNAFLGRDPTNVSQDYYGMASYIRPDRFLLSRNKASTIVGTIYNQIAVDVAMVDIKHVIVDEEENYVKTINDPLNRLLSIQANIDQTGRQFIIDTAMSMFDEGCVALVPTSTTEDPNKTDSFKVGQSRVGKVVEWFPYHVKVDVYNEKIGRHQIIMLEKRYTPIIENPFYATMNEQNSTAQRLIRVLNQLDYLNEQNSSGKIDLLIQLPYALKTDLKRNQAEDRREKLEKQLVGSKYGVGYIDSTEKVIQLNRAVDNNLWNQAKELLAELYNELGLSQSIFDGTADEATMVNYNNRTLKPVLTSITDEITRKWLSSTAITQMHRVKFYSDPFKLIPMSQMADIADKFTRNEILSANEVRTKLGIRPSDDPKADELRNANLNHPDEQVEAKETVEEEVEE